MILHQTSTFFKPQPIIPSLGEQIHHQLTQPHVGWFSVVLGVPKQIDGDVGQLEGQG
jgi:hypothetical protein